MSERLEQVNELSSWTRREDSERGRDWKLTGSLNIITCAGSFDSYAVKERAWLN